MFGIGLSDAYGRGDFMSVSKNDTKGRQNGGGDAYVRAAQKFDSYTLHVMLNCPERWREYLVTPITNDTRRIANDTVMANSCYVRMDRQSALEDVSPHMTSAYRILRMPCAPSGSSSAT